MARRSPASPDVAAPQPIAPGAVTALIERARAGDVDAEASVVRLVYDDLHRVAGHLLARELQNNTLQTTDLVHEAYLRLAGAAASAESRSHFIGIAARAMRQVLVDRARKRNAVKRDGIEVRITAVDPAVSVDFAEVIALDDALARLAKRNPRAARVVELRYFAGLTEPEIAALLGVTERTVQRDWVAARAWLHKELGDGKADPSLPSR
jgi:RNA polymerase sigma factor (TIGR02999 family)